MQRSMHSPMYACMYVLIIGAVCAWLPSKFIQNEKKKLHLFRTGKSSVFDDLPEIFRFVLTVLIW